MPEISKEYASALFALAKEQHREKEFLDALREMETAFSRSPEYALLLSAPNIPMRERKALLAQAFADRVPEYVLSFAELLCEKRHIRQFTSCVEEYEKLYKELSSVTDALIVSAVALTEQEKESLVKGLERRSGKSVAARYRVDESLLGGLTVYMEDTVIDGSLRHKLKEIKEVIDK